MAESARVGRTTVDGYLYDDKDFAAIEVKNAARLDARDFAGLKKFKCDYAEARAVLLYRGDEQYLEGDVLVVPIDRFLRGLLPGLSLPDMQWRRQSYMF